MRVVSKLLLVFVFMLWTNAALRAEEHATDDEVYEYVTTVPRNIEKDLGQLTRYLVRPYNDKYDKAKAIAFWIASHVVYDGFIFKDKPNAFGYNEMTSFGKKYGGQHAWELAESRVGICEDYSELFMDMAIRAGIRAKIETGKIRRVGEEYKHIPKRFDLEHAWNSFKYNGRDIYVDVTWMANGPKMMPENGNLITESQHNRAVKKRKKENRKESRIYPINPYYFDFDYDKYNKDSHPRNERNDTGTYRIKDRYYR